MFKYYLSKLIKKLHVPAIKNSRIDKTSRVCSGSHLVNVSLAKYSYIGNFCTVLNANIGAFCSIADNVIIGGMSHPLEWVSTSPVFYAGKNVLKKNYSSRMYKNETITNIGNDVWIGNNCLIKSGISVGNGAVVGMGSILTKNVGPYEIWAGNPARFIRKRFSDDVALRLLDTNWWDFKETELAEFVELFNLPEEFLHKFY